MSDITNSTQRYHYLQITVNSACHRDMHAAKQWCERRHIVRHYDEQDTNIQCLCFSDIAYRDMFIISTQTAVAGGGVHRRLSVCLVVCLSARYLKKNDAAIGSPNMTYKYSTMSLRKPLILGSKGQMSRSRVTKTLSACGFCSLFSAGFLMWAYLTCFFF